MTIGVYMFKSPVSDNCYVGSGIIEARQYQHLWKLRKGIHHSIVFQRAFDKYGERLEFYILWTCSEKSHNKNQNKLRDKEQ